ncbi:MAG: phosphatase, partial [Cyanobacteria bacterium P01_A01_bin.37]
MTLRALKLVIFDMAGTTVRDDEEVERCFMEVAHATGLNAERERIISMMGWTKQLVFKTLWSEQIGIDHPKLSQKVDDSDSKFTIVLEDYYRNQPVIPTVGCLDLFSWLNAQ